MWPFSAKSKVSEASAGSWLLVGLGNPGRKYAGTRHNAGAMVLEALIRRSGDALGPLKENKKLKGLVSKGRLADTGAVLLFPTTYMNLSGEAVQAAASFYKIPPERTLLIFDDKDIPLGQLRLRPEGGAGGHNGVKSVIQRLGTQRFPRLRVGIGGAAADRAGDTADFVLGKPSKAERAALEDAVSRAAAAAETVLREGLDAAMNQHN
jgi:PTH1 family peptidyl-tRNA hydrolase